MISKKKKDLQCLLIGRSFGKRIRLVQKQAPRHHATVSRVGAHFQIETRSDFPTFFRPPGTDSFIKLAKRFAHRLAVDEVLCFSGLPTDSELSYVFERCFCEEKGRSGDGSEDDATMMAATTAAVKRKMESETAGEVSCKRRKLTPVKKIHTMCL